MATILRHRRKRDFTVLPNGMLRDPRLSFRATGLLAYLLMLPDGEGVDSTSLSERKREGRDAIRASFHELESAGYMVKRKEQGPGGLWSTVLEVTDEPETGNQASDNRGLENRTSVDQALSTTKNSLQSSASGQDEESVDGIKDNGADREQRLSQDELDAARAARTGRRTSQRAS